MNKTIHVDLSVSGIEKAIRDLEKYRQRIEDKTAQLVDELVDGGAEMARYAFGGTASVDKVSENGTGIIEAVGNSVIIMEFGAGLATMESHPLAHNAPVDVSIGSYSRENGGLFWETYQTIGESAYWIFGGRAYSRVEPRHGMLDARDYIVSNLEEKARSVFE